MSKEKCAKCGTEKSRYELKQGWTNCLYCSENCERAHVSGVHGSMPGSGPLPRNNWVPAHVSREISSRWADA